MKLITAFVRSELEKLLSVFGSRNKEILKLYFGFYNNSPMKVKDIAVLYNLAESLFKELLKYL